MTTGIPPHVQNNWTYAVTRLVMIDGGVELASGSGFFWKHGAKWFLITNWHNLAGINPCDNSLLSPTSRRPSKVSFTAHVRIGDEDQRGFFTVDQTVNRVSLHLYDERMSSAWYEHRVRTEG
jgi:hypothetical protein